MQWEFSTFSPHFALRTAILTPKRTKGGDLPRAHLYFLPGHIWHITHRCPKQDILLILERDSCWPESLAVGDEVFVANIKAGLRIKGWNRTVIKERQDYVLRESEDDYAILPLEFPL